MAMIDPSSDGRFGKILNMFLIDFKLAKLCLVGGGMSKFQSLVSGKEVSQTLPSVGCKYWK